VVVSSITDTEPPVTTAVLQGTHNPGFEKWFNAPVGVVLNAVDMPLDTGSGVSKIEFKINDGLWQIYPDTTPLIGTEGVNTFSFKSTDVVGNEEAVQSIDVNIDQSAPLTTPIVSGTMGNNGWWISTLNVLLDANDR
jgi:hypothetical protein